ncbi:hypothetical protein AB6A40_005956 [Gnathostoma spinigerum]|uniref:Saposin B-type domain-containing protein n=1 Tax=Gnathostoma spinigerum TaxID=75299 RepID=A0ABD6ERE1_9BILA
MQDKHKIEELKTILRFMCHETTYVEECKAFVNELDAFIAKLLPYLADQEKVCQHFHMCSNLEINQYHRIAVLYAQRYESRLNGMTDLLCDECQFASKELKEMVENEETRQKVKRFLTEDICSHLGKLQGSCNIMVEQFVPQIFDELDKLLVNSKQFCAELGLCPARMFGSFSESEEHLRTLSRFGI